MVGKVWIEKQDRAACFHIWSFITSTTKEYVEKKLDHRR